MPQAAAAMCYNRLIERGFGRVARGGPTVPVRRKEALAVGVFLLLYFVLNLLFLTRYPLVLLPSSAELSLSLEGS